MSAKNDKTVRQLVEAIRAGGRAKTSPYDTTATVRRIEDGVAWVHIPGGVDETPVKLTIAASPGDTVQVRVAGGRAFLVGNATAPPTDDKTAQKAVKQIGVVNKAVKAVRQIAERAAKIAGNTNQYFWHTETGTDTGAHITEIPQEDFLRDPEHGGGNLLARSNGIAVRNGLDELASFSSDGLLIQMQEDAYYGVSIGLAFLNGAIRKGMIWASETYGDWMVLENEIRNSITAICNRSGQVQLLAPKIFIAHMAPVSNGIDPEDVEVEVSGKLTVSGDVIAGNIGATESGSGSFAISTAGIDTYETGPNVFLAAGVWVVSGQWVFQTGASSGARNMGVQLSPTYGTSGSGAYKMVRVNAASNAFASLEITDIITLTTPTRVYLKGASSATYTTTATCTIKAVRIK